MTRRDKIALSLLKPINPSLIIVLGIYTIVWGLWIASPFWTVFPQAPLYDAMARFAGEYAWGAFAIASGLFTTRGAIKPSYKNLQIGSFMAFLHWFIITIFYFMGDWMNTGGITALTFAVYSGLIWLNVKINKSHFSGD